MSIEPVSNERTWESNNVDMQTGEITKKTNKATVCNFSVGANEGYGEHRTQQFFRINAWHGLGEICQNYLKKGRQVYIEGVPSVKTYVGSDNKVHASIEVRADRVELMQDGKRITATETETVADDEALY